MSVAQWSEYDEKMLSAFVAKPKKMAWYRDLYDRATSSGSLLTCWKWSWWAFLSGGALFLFYRKVYPIALAIFSVNLFCTTFMQQAVYSRGGSWLIGRSIDYGITFVALGIIIGGLAPYFIIKRYCDLKEAIESKYANEDDRIAAMARHGGVHQWVVTVFKYLLIFNLCLLLILFIRDFVLG
ncbi:MAG: hypothetical protein LBO72_03570 [Helicobacteraceae bacterium]|jgi:hypothetical protein|nr:hypothetical protein [Helicobacteraceae bacterium]